MVTAQSASQIVDAIMKRPEGTKVMIVSPLVRGQKGTHKEVLEAMTRQGFVRCRIDGTICEIKAAPAMDKNFKHTVEAVVDRLVIKPDIRTRLADSVELSLKLADGLVTLVAEETAGSNKWVDHPYSSKYACVDHPEASLEELSPRLFSFNSPWGACDSCHGLGVILVFDQELVIPDVDAAGERGDLCRSASTGHAINIWYKRVMRRFCRDFGVDETTPFSDLPEKVKKILMKGTTAKDAKEFGEKFEGVLPMLQRRWETTESEFVKQRLSEYLSEQPCETCKGKRLKPQALAVKVGKQNIQEVTALTIARALEFFNGLKLDVEQTKIAAPVLKEVRARLGFMNDVGLGYLSLDRQTGSLSGGEFQRIRLATQVGGAALVGVACVLDEPTIGLHQRDNDRLIKTLRHLADIGNTVIVVEHDEDDYPRGGLGGGMWGRGRGLMVGRLLRRGRMRRFCNRRNRSRRNI